MKVRVKLFAVAKELAGRDEVTIDVPTGATIVCTFGLVLILMALVRPLFHVSTADLHQVAYTDRAHGAAD